MKDITLKPDSLRTATATAVITMPEHCVALLQNRQVDKGDALEIARMAAIMAAKKTEAILPFCHQVPLRAADVKYTFEADKVIVESHVECIGPTGVEMEALTAASVCCLTLYDMLKPHCTQTDMEIGGIHLLQKRGGKSHFRRQLKGDSTAAILVLSDTVASGKKPDTAGLSVKQGLEQAGFTTAAYDIVPDEADAIRQWLDTQLANEVDAIITVGGTGVGHRDVTVETVAPYITKPLPGVMEAARQFGQDRTPYSMMSGGIAGMVGHSFVATFPGSRKGAEETLAATLAGIIHLVEVCRISAQHEGGYQ